MTKTKLSLGAGMEAELGSEWLNLDLIKLPNIKVVWNLMNFPWPFENETFEYIKAKDLLEHLDHYAPIQGTTGSRPTIIAFVEECYRILKPDGVLWIQTPRYDAEFLYIDPTHVKGFHPNTMDFFDSDTDFGKSGGFISKANFKVSVLELDNKNLQFTMIKR